MTKEHPQWFQSWFDTPYYHILYKHRDYQEAEVFIKNILTYLNLDKDDSILDLACGKGRHSIFLNSLGHKVTGLDLSKNNIEYAKKHESNSLSFEVHDMRNTYKIQFEVVLNRENEEFLMLLVKMMAEELFFLFFLANFFVW